MHTKFISVPQSSSASGRVRDFLSKTNRAIAAQFPGGSSEEIEKAMTKLATGPADTLTGEDLVTKLIKDNQDLWNRLLTNEFCTEMKEKPGDDENVLRGFKWYMMQDFLYCFKGVTYEVDRAPKAASPQEFDISMDRAGEYASYTKTILKTCIDKLEIKYSDELFTYQTEALEKYIEFLLKTAANASNWVVALVAMIPCIQSYYMIAADLVENSEDKNSIWYNLWAEVNNDPVYADDQKKFFFDNTDQWSDHYEEANKIFQEACNHEIAFWNTALNPPF